MPEDAAKTGLPEDEEQRGSARSRSLVGGTIVFRDGARTVPCIVRNRTEYGAQLEIAADQLIPKRFFLVTSKSTQVFEAGLIWRNANRIGVTLGRTIDPATTTERALQFLRVAAAARADRETRSWEDESRWPV